MAYSKDLTHFRQCRSQAARKRELEAHRAQLLPQQEERSAQAETCRSALQAAEAEVNELAAGGAKGFLYTIAGGKAQRQARAQEVLREAKAKDQQAAWDLAQVQTELAQTEGELEGLAGAEEALTAARQARSDALKAAGLPQSRQLTALEEAAAQGAGLVHTITHLCAQSQAALTSAQATARLADEVGNFRVEIASSGLGYASDQGTQQQEALAQGLTALLAQAERAHRHLVEALDDLLAQPFPFDLPPDPEAP